MNETTENNRTLTRAGAYWGNEVPTAGDRMASSLTIIEHFAAMAMQGLLANAPISYSTIRIAVKYADALIGALNKEEQI